MDWTGSVSCQNCSALNKKLELFELLKQKCCKTDDITKNFLLLKTSYEKSAKVLENKSKKLSEARTKLKDASKVEESFKRKAAEFQLRLVSSENKCQDLVKDLEVERDKNYTLLQEKLSLDNLLEKKENEITSLNIISKQCEEKFSNEINILNAKMEKKVDGLKADIQKLQDSNVELKKNLKKEGGHKKRHDKLREDLCDIFKDGVILSGESLKRFKKLLSRLQENENAAKLEAMLDTPSMTPDGTTSTDTGVFSGDEDIGCPSLGNDLEMSSDSDEDLENVPLQSNVSWSVPPGSNPVCFELSKATSSPFEDRFPTIEPDAELTQDTSSTNLSNGSFSDIDNTLCPISNESTSDIGAQLKLTDATSESEPYKHFDDDKSVQTSEHSSSSTKAEGLPNVVEHDLNVNDHASIKSPAARTSRKLSLISTLDKSNLTDSNHDAVSHAATTDSLFSPPGGDASPSLKSQEKNDSYEISFDMPSSLSTKKCLDSQEMLPIKSDSELPASTAASVPSSSESKITDVAAPSSAEKLTKPVDSPTKVEKQQEPLCKGQENLDLSEDSCLEADGLDVTPVLASESCTNSHAVKINSNAVSGERLVEEDTSSNSHNIPKSSSDNIPDDSIQETRPEQDEMDLDTMLHEWSPPTPILPFSDDSCGFESSSNFSVDQSRKISMTVSVGTNTDMKLCVARASSPISHLFMKSSTTSTDEDFKQEKRFKDAFCTPPKSCNKASSPMKIRCKNIGVMPITELRRNVAVSPMKVMKTSSATSPVRSQLKEVSLSPVRWQKLDCSTTPCNLGTIETVNEQGSWSREASMLQQTLEVLGISSGDSSDVVLDQSLVDELRKAMEMALRKTSRTAHIPMKTPVPSTQLNTSFCSFDPCEFAEICNQQHYNLHLLAKAKRVEKTLCSREKRSKLKIKRLQTSSQKQKSVSAQSFKEEVPEEDDSSQTNILGSLIGGSVNEGEMIKQMKFARPQIPSQGPKIIKPVVPEIRYPPQSSAKNPKIKNSVVSGIIHSSESDVNFSNFSSCKAAEEENAIASSQLQSATSDTSDAGCNVVENISTDIEKHSMDLASTIVPDISDSETEGNLMIDESISPPPVPSEVTDCKEISEETCNQPVHMKESADDFVLPKPVRKSLRKRQQSTSSESSNAENSCVMNDNAVAPRRSPRTKKVRIAHGGANANLQSFKNGYINFVKGESTIPCKDDASVKSQSVNTSLSSKVCDVEQPKCTENLERINSICVSNTKPSEYRFKRKADDKAMDEEISKRSKQQLTPSSPIVENELEVSEVGIEIDANQSAETENAKARSTRMSSSARKPTKLQKLRSSVSRVHPMVQAAKPSRSPEVTEEHLKDPLEQHMKSQAPQSDSQGDSKVGENSKERDEAAIIERLRGKGTVRSAAAASGRTAQLIQVKPGAKRHQRPAENKSPAGHLPIKPLTRVARTQPLVRPADRVNALENNTPTKPIVKPTDSVLPVNTNPTSNTLGLLNGVCQESPVSNTPEQRKEESPSTNLSVLHKEENYESFLISNVNLTVSKFNPLTCAFAEQENAPPPACSKKDLIPTQILVTRTLKEFTAAPAFTNLVLQKAVDALSAPHQFILPVLVQKIVHMMDDDYDSAPLRLGNQQSFVPPLSPVQQQLVTLIVQLSSQHQHLQQLPHQVLRLLEYRVFRLGVTPEGERLVWCSKLYAAICRIHCLRTQALIFCWDSLYALRGRSYFVVKAVMDVWPHLFPINPSFEKACPNAQVLLHLLRSHGEDKKAAQENRFDNSWLKRLLRSSALQSLSINSSILASSIFSNIKSGGPDTNVAALVLLAKREEENWTMRDVVSQKLLPALDSWRNGSLSHLVGERIIWILCSILRAIPPERNGNTSTTLMMLLKSELLKPNSTLPPQMQEVVAVGLALLSRHDIENVAHALASWSPKYGSSRGFSSCLLQYLTSLIKSGTRPVPWWQAIVVRFLKSGLEE